MTIVRDYGIPFGSLLLFWVMLNGSLSPDVLMVGAGAAALITLVFRNTIAFFGDFRFADPAAWLAALGYFSFFFKELLKSNVKLARVVLAPSLPVNPGIVKTHTRLKSRMGRLLLANSITLTPGTLTVELDGEWLYIHWVNMESADVERATAAIVTGFERYLEVMYG